MLLNGVIALILHFFTEFDCLLANYVTVVEYRPIMSVKIVSQFLSSIFGHNQPTRQRGLSAIAELLYWAAVSFSCVVCFYLVYTAN